MSRSSRIASNSTTAACSTSGSAARGRDWRGQGHFRALTEEQEVWALANGFDEILVKTKNRFYEMRAALAQLHFNVIKFVPHTTDNRESKVFLSKRLGQHVVDAHRSRRFLTRRDS